MNSTRRRLCMVPIVSTVSFLLVGCESLSMLTGDDADPQASSPVAHGCEVNQQLPIGAPCEWIISDLDGLISVESHDGRGLSLTLNIPGPCAFRGEILDPDETLEAPSWAGGCVRILNLKDRRLEFGDGRTGGRMVEFIFGEQGWTVVQAPPTRPR